MIQLTPAQTAMFEKLCHSAMEQIKQMLNLQGTWQTPSDATAAGLSLQPLSCLCSPQNWRGMARQPQKTAGTEERTGEENT